MSRIIVDPDELERFVRKLRQFTVDVSEGASELQAQFLSLGQTWSDREHTEFAEEFEKMMRTLQNFTRASEEQIPYLIRRAQLIRDYLRS